MKKLSAFLFTTLITAYGTTFNVSTTPELRTALESAATNGKDDTIILADGTYKTTDDGNGTFIYLSNESYSLTLQGSSSENVILSGDNQHQILNHQSTENAPIILEKLSFIDGNNTSSEYFNNYPNYYGGGVYTAYYLRATDCLFSNNKANYGGGFYSRNSSIKNSKFLNNSANRSGGGFYSDAATIVDSDFNSNSAGTDGGGFFTNNFDNETIIETTTFSNNNAKNGGGFLAHYKPVTVISSKFLNNNATSKGGGFMASFGICCSTSPSIIQDTIFFNNTASSGGGFYTYYSKVIQSIIYNNTASFGGGFYSENSVIVVNTLLNNNNSGTFIENGNDSIIYNSIFFNNGSYDINGSSEVIISKLENNYIDLSNIMIYSFPSNNIFDGITLGFVDEVNGDYNLTSSSDLIDTGIISVSSETLPITDFNGNARVVGGSIDIGPYEFSTTKPTINSITYTGEAKEATQLTFTTDYTLADSRTISKLEYDYENDETWTTLDTHTYNTKGTYVLNVKITDSQGEFSSNTKTITIVELPFSEMTDEQKLVKAIDPQYYDVIVEIINSKANLNSITNSSIDSMQSGWTLSGTANEITDMSIFNNASIVWVYTNSEWKAYSSNATMIQNIQDANIPLINSIPDNSGIWVYK